MQADDYLTCSGSDCQEVLERFERDVWEARSDCVLGLICLLFLSDILLFGLERKRCKLDNIVGSMASVEKVYERAKR